MTGPLIRCMFVTHNRSLANRRDRDAVLDARRVHLDPTNRFSGRQYLRRAGADHRIDIGRLARGFRGILRRNELDTGIDRFELLDQSSRPSRRPEYAWAYASPSFRVPAFAPLRVDIVREHSASAAAVFRRTRLMRGSCDYCAQQQDKRRPVHCGSLQNICIAFEHSWCWRSPTFSGKRRDCSAPRELDACDG